MFNKNKYGCFYIADPTNKEENLADKWNTHPERARAFFNFLEDAQRDFNREKLEAMDRLELARHLKKILGEEVVTRVYDEMAEESKDGQNQGLVRVDPKQGVLSVAGSIVVPAVHHYGE